MDRDGAELPWSKSGPLYRSCRAEKLSCKFVGRHQSSRSNPALCQVWEALAAGILIVDLTFYSQWNLPPVRHQLPCSDGFAGLGSRCSSLANRIGATVWNWHSKLAKLVFQAVLVTWRIWAQISTAKVLCIAKTWRCEVVGSQQFSQSIPASCCVREDLALLIVDLTFHGQCQWHLFQVQCQPPCSHGFACLGSKRRSLADRTAATIEVVVARCNKCSSKLCLFFGPVEPRSLQQMWLHKNYNFGTAATYQV